MQNPPTHTKFKFGQEVRKTKGSCWQGKVVGFYTTSLTPEGYAVESRWEQGSVQIYPAAALELVEYTIIGEISDVAISKLAQKSLDEVGVPCEARFSLKHKNGFLTGLIVGQIFINDIEFNEHKKIVAALEKIGGVQIFITKEIYHDHQADCADTPKPNQQRWDIEFFLTKPQTQDHV